MSNLYFLFLKNEETEAPTGLWILFYSHNKELGFKKLTKAQVINISVIMYENQSDFFLGLMKS